MFFNLIVTILLLLSIVHLEFRQISKQILVAIKLSFDMSHIMLMRMRSYLAFTMNPGLPYFEYNLFSGKPDAFPYPKGTYG